LISEQSGIDLLKNGLAQKGRHAEGCESGGNPMETYWLNNSDGRPDAKKQRRQGQETW
jgi:hypothetical protein